MSYRSSLVTRSDRRRPGHVLSVLTCLLTLGVLLTGCSGGGGSGGITPATVTATVTVVPPNPLINTQAAIDVMVMDQSTVPPTPVQGATATISATGTGNTVTQPAGPSGASGLITGAISSTDPGLKLLTITVDPDPNDPNALPFVVSSSVAFCDFSDVLSSLTANPTVVLADGVATSTITAVVKDLSGNTVAGAAVEFVLTGTGNILNPGNMVNTNASGEAVVTLASAVAETKNIAAIIDPAVCAVPIAQTVTVTFSNCIIDDILSTVDAAPLMDVIADGVDASTITVTLVDQAGNPVSAYPVQLDVNGSGNLLTPAGPYVTDVNGIVTADLTSTKAEVKTVTATVDPGGPCELTLSDTAMITFIPGCVDPDQPHSTLQAAPVVAIADGVDTSTITVLVRDTFDNPIPGATVALSATGTGNTIVTTPGVTDPAGMFVATIASNVAETKVITANITQTSPACPNGAITVSLTQMAMVTFVACTPNPNPPHSTVSASPVQVVANGADTSSIAILVRDNFDNPIQGAQVQITATGSNNVITPPNPVTDQFGIAMATISSTTPEPKVISASVTVSGPVPPCTPSGPTTLVETATVTFTVAPPVTCTLDALPMTIVVGGSTTLTSTVVDGLLAPIQGAQVMLTSTGSDNVFTPMGPQATNSAGQAVSSLSSTKAEAKVLTSTATVGPLQGTCMQTVTFVACTPDPNPPQSVVTASPLVVVANGIATSTITVLIRDQYLNPIAGADVTISATGTGHVITPAVAVTGADGIATATIASTTVGMTTISASVSVNLPAPCMPFGPVTLVSTAMVDFVPFGGGGEGCSHGFWKNHGQTLGWPNPYTPSQLFSTVFEDAFPGLTMDDVLNLGGGGLNALGREAVAALMNATEPNINYLYTEADVINMFNQVYPGAGPQYEALKNMFESQNTLHGPYCN